MRHLISCALVLALANACTSAGGVVDPSDALFDPDRVLQISISMDPKDWEELVAQKRHYLDVIGESCNESPPERPYTYFPADIAIDGEIVADVGVRQKGFFGSVNQEKPSLKVSFSEYVSGQTYADQVRLTLNNNNGDPSQVKQCLGYALFRAAGLPASRCNLAVVEVNGTPLGTYSHVESIKKPFLARHFGDDESNLYEGTLADFLPGWVNMFERKNNKHDPYRGDIEALVQAVEVDDDILIETLDPLVDLDRFYDHWALEVLLMHGDGYARNTNNYYIYNDPASGRFVFIPWGIDVILQPDQTWDWEQQPPPGTAWAAGVLARRLYLHPMGQAAYLARLQELLEELWIEENLLAEIDRMEELLTPHLTDYQEFIAERIQAVRDYVETRRGDLQAILDQTPAQWDEPLRDPWCLPQIGEITGSFDGFWGTLDVPDPFDQGDALLELELDGDSYNAQPSSLIAGFDEHEQPVLRQLFWTGDETALMVEISLDEFELDVPLPHDFDIPPGGGSVTELIYLDVGDLESSEIRALFGGGTLHLEDLTTVVGGLVRGSFSASLYPDQD